MDDVIKLGTVEKGDVVVDVDNNAINEWILQRLNRVPDKNEKSWMVNFSPMPDNTSDDKQTS